MIWLFSILVLVILGVFIYFYKQILSKINEIKIYKEEINEQFDIRFKLFEQLINSIRKTMDYEQTLLTDVVLFRSQAQSAKLKNDDALQFHLENKIGKIASKLDIVLKEYEIDNFESINVKEEIKKQEEIIQSHRQNYNELVRELGKIKNNPISNLILMIISNINVSYPLWEK